MTVTRYQAEVARIAKHAERKATAIVRASLTADTFDLDRTCYAAGRVVAAANLSAALLGDAFVADQVGGFADIAVYKRGGPGRPPDDEQRVITAVYAILRRPQEGDQVRRIARLARSEPGAGRPRRRGPVHDPPQDRSVPVAARRRPLQRVPTAQPQDLPDQRAADLAPELQLHARPDPEGLTMTTGTDPAPNDTPSAAPSSPTDAPDSTAGGPTGGQAHQTGQDNAPNYPPTFTREYVQRLRDEAASHRVKAKRADTLVARLVTALANSHRLADPTDLTYSPDLLDDDGLPDEGKVVAAIEDLLTRKPHLASRRPLVSDVGQGAQPQDDAVSLADLLRAGAG